MTAANPRPKVPADPPSTLQVDDALHIHLLDEGTWLWRVSFTESPHVLPWNELRHYGPVPENRFDPHPLPLGVHVDEAVMYTALHFSTALAEVFQEHVIDRFLMGPMITGWPVTRELTLLDLTSNWALVNGAAAAIQMGSKEHTQAWARAIEDQLGARFDGLYHHSSMNNAPLVTLFARVETFDAFPKRPGYSKLLRDPGARSIITRARHDTGYGVV